MGTTQSPENRFSSHRKVEVIKSFWMSQLLMVGHPLETKKSFGKMSVAWPMEKLFHWLEHILDTIYPIVMVIDTVSILFPLQAMKINEILFTQSLFLKKS